MMLETYLETYLPIEKNFKLLTTKNFVIIQLCHH